MNENERILVERARRAAVEVLEHNAKGPYHGLPRTAGWGYPEPYTRDMMICSLGFLVSDSDILKNSLRKVLETVAKNQTPLGHIPSLIHDPNDCGASDCTPLFLMGVGLWRKATGETDFLQDAVRKSLTWMEYQKPSGDFLVSQQPTSDWRDEQWVLGYGLFVNTIVYTYLRLFADDKAAENFYQCMERFTVKGETQHRHVHEGLVLRRKPYFALWSYKVYASERFDLLGNSIAMLNGLASPTRCKDMIHWIECECDHLKARDDLGCDMPPNFFPFIRPEDPDWKPRYERYNKPGDYHNGGIWPFVCGFYVAALVAAQRYELAEKKLLELTRLIKMTRIAEVEFGFNEWIKAQNCRPMGQDWQSWSAAMYLYAAKCVEEKSTPFFDEMRENNDKLAKEKE